MSSLYVRNTIRGWLNNGTLTAPFYDTINKEQNPPEESWLTVDFEVIEREKLAFCDGEWREEGEVSLMFNGAAGVGDGQLLAIAEKDVKALLANRDATRQLIITGVQGVSELSAGSARQHYQIEYVLEYEFQEIQP